MEDVSPSRRSFLASLFAIAATPRLMPGVAPIQCGIPSSAEESELQIVHNIIGTLIEIHEPKWAFTWAQTREGGGDPKLMLWTPETEDEIASAMRIKNTLTSRSWETPADLVSLVRQREKWLVRLSLKLGVYLFLSSETEKGIVGSGTGDVSFCSSPTDAAVVRPERAQEIILDLSMEGGKQTTAFLLEPVEPSNPWRDDRYRFLDRARQSN